MQQEQSPAETVSRAEKLNRALATLLVAVVLGAAPWAYRCTSPQAFNPDPFLYGQSAKDVLNGKRLYEETWQNKPPLGILAYAVPQLVRPRSYRSITLFHGACLAVQGLMFAWAFRATPWAAVCCAVFVAWFPLTHLDFLWPSTESFSNLFIAGNLLLALWIQRQGRVNVWHGVAWGVLTCVAFHVRQNSLFSGLIPGAVIVLGPMNWRSKAAAVAGAVAGGAACLGLILLLVSRIGSVSGYWYTVYEYPREFAKAGRGSYLGDMVGVFVSCGLSFVTVLFAGLAIQRRYWLLALSSLTVGFLACFLPLRPFPHYWLNFLPYLALLMGIGVAGIEQVRPRLTWAFPAAMAVLIWVAGYKVFWQVDHGPWFVRPLEEIAAKADELGPPGGTIWVAGPVLQAEPIMFFSKLTCAHVHWVPFQMDPPWDTILPQKLESVFADFLAKPPDVLVYHLQSMQGAPGAGCNRLIKALTDRYPYHKGAEMSGHVIVVRQQPGAASNQPRIQL